MKTILLLFVTLSHGSQKRARYTSPDSSRAVFNVGVTARGRIIEEYNSTLVRNYYGPQLASMLGSLTRADQNNTAFIPLENSMNESTLVGVLQLGQRIAVSHQSVIFAFGSKLLIKYQANCIELRRQREMFEKPFLHPSVVEYAFTRRAAAFGLAPSVFALSPPVSLFQKKEGKCNFSMTDEEFQICKMDPNSSFRYMVVQRVIGPNLYSYRQRYPNETLPLATGMMIGEELMRMLELLHTTARVVHGDIHMGNIMIEKISRESISMKFVDFARSFENIQRPPGRTFIQSTHQLLSAWEMAGYYPAARDDVYRVVETVARLVNPPEYTFFMDWLGQVNPLALLQHKLWRNVFEIPEQTSSPIDPYDPVEQVPIAESTREAIRDELKQLLSLVREMIDDVNAIPRYSEMREGFRRCRILALGTL